MLKKTLSHRSQATIVSDLVGRWIIKNNPTMQDKFYISDKAISSFDYRFMFTKKWQPFVKMFNLELAVMKENGELARIDKPSYNPLASLMDYLVFRFSLG